MKKPNVLFDWPLVEITRLTDSLEAETFVATLDAPAEAEFTSLAEVIRGIGEDLQEAKDSCSHFTGWTLLLQNVKDFLTRFPAFPNAAYRKFVAFIILADMLSNTNATFDTDDVNEALFEIRTLDTQLPVYWYVRENNSNYENSIVVMCCNDFNLMQHQFQEDIANISPRIIFHILATISQVSELPNTHFTLIKNSNLQIPAETVKAFVNFHILAKGKEIHVPRKYIAPPETGNLDDITPEHPYHQWNDVFEVLSEYNSRSEPLLKFLTIYHVVENFMFKRPIVELETSQNGRMFSIRDFRRLYKEVDMGEEKALAKLFTAAFPSIVSGTTTIQQSVTLRWQNLSTTVSPAEIDSALAEMGINKRYANFASGNQVSSSFCELVYKMRCAIVHNKETEFHLTYASLTNGFIALIELFLLPALEEFCFVLLGVKNQIIWYLNRDLKLF